MENLSCLKKFKRISFKSIFVCPLWYEENLKPIILLSITSDLDLIPLGTANPHGSERIFAALSIGRLFLWNPGAGNSMEGQKGLRGVSQPHLFLYSPRPYFFLSREPLTSLIPSKSQALDCVYQRNCAASDRCALTLATARKGMTEQAAINIDIFNLESMKHVGQVLSSVWKQLKMEPFLICQSLFIIH